MQIRLHYLRASFAFGLCCISLAIFSGLASASTVAPSGTVAHLLAVSTMATPSVVPTSVPFSRAEQNNARLIYVGPWKQTASASYSGGSARSVSDKGALVAARFNGTAIRWIGPAGSGFGRAELYLDGRYVATVDQSSSRAVTKRTVWASAALAEGSHRLEIRVLGTDGAVGKGHRITIDALDVRGSLTPPAPPSDFLRFEEKDARITLFGRWETLSTALASGGASRRSVSNGSGYTIAFKGPAISLAGPVGPILGKGYVYLDGKYVGATTQWASRSSEHQLLWSAIGLANTSHLVEVRPQSPTGTTTNRLALDAVYINGSVDWAPRRIEEKDSRVAAAGTWASSISRGMSGDTYRYCPAGGGAIRLAFTGSSVRVLGLRSPSSGEAEVVLDGVSQGVISLYSSSTRVQQVIWSKSGLGTGKHVLEIRALGSAVARGRGERVGIDGFDVSGTVFDAPKPVAFSPVEEDDARLAASGTWNTIANSSMSSRAYLSSADERSALTVSFVGTGLRWIGPKSSGFGSAQVFVDGKLQGTANQTSASTLYRREIWSVSGLAPGDHTVQIRVADAGAGSSRPVAIDVMHVLEGSLREAPRPPGVARVPASDARTALVGSWSLRATSADAATSELRTRDIRSRFAVTFHGTAVTWIGSRGPDFGIAEVVLDGRTQGTIDLYDYATTTKRVLWSARSLSDRDHRLTIRLVGRHNSSSSSYNTSVEALDVTGQVLESGSRFGADDWRLVYGGTWSSRVSTLTSGLAKASEQPSSTLTVRFSGTRLRILGTTDMASGIASVSVDGKAWQEADFYSAQAQGGRVVFDTGVLKTGEHSARLFVTGRGKSVGTGVGITVDGFDVADGTLVPQTGAQKARMKATDTAIAQLGKRYVWAGVGPTVFDCSGLMLYSYKAAGMKLPHYSGSQWGLCVPKRASELLPGDLCFDDRPGYIHHVGMYIGDGITINAPGTGHFVEYRSISTYGCFGRLKSSLWPK